MTPVLITLSAIIALFAGSYFCLRSTGFGNRLLGLFLALGSVAMLSVQVGMLLGMNEAIDLCKDETAGYFKEHNRFAPFCR